MPEVLEASVPWMPIAAFFGGGALFMGLEKLIHSIQHRLGAGGESSGLLAILTGCPWTCSATG
ncbi:hypothetical protein AUQ48_16935 [Kocuria flava]|uniref:Uncharacterized protein n=1 Tax=Kocuria flava TaxID=446860 RepID=A0A2N4SXN8_9MICC|nr:hypothetical protein AUQ48_16935 [Kocuria flava]